MKIYIGNLCSSVTENDLRDLFSGYGEIESVALIKDKYTGASRGFGFIEMPDAAAQSAIEEKNGQELKGKTLTVNEARERERSGFGGGGSRNGGGNGGGNYRGNSYGGRR